MPKKTDKVDPPWLPCPAVYVDQHRHTCIVVARQSGVVQSIPLNILGLEVVEIGEEAFDREWQPDNDYPVDRAAKLYAAYAADLGGSPEAMRELAKLTNLTQEVIAMATSKKAATDKAAPAKKTAAPAKTGKKAEAPAKATKAAATKDAGEKRYSAAQMFKDLIMEGKLTDDQIFAKVQKEFNLDDNKRSYVKWYRNDLNKKGLNPPAAKG